MSFNVLQLNVSMIDRRRFYATRWNYINHGKSIGKSGDFCCEFETSIRTNRVGTYISILVIHWWYIGAIDENRVKTNNPTHEPYTRD